MAAAPALAHPAAGEHLQAAGKKAHKSKKKPTATPVKAKSKKAAHKKKHKKHRKKKTHATATSLPAAPPAPTAPATATSTSTPTPTPTNTPTPTDTPTPLPELSTIGVTVDMSHGYQIGFYACGLPHGATAAFNPNPVAAVPDASSSTGSSATSALTVSVPNGTPPGEYQLVLYGAYKNPSGQVVGGPPSGAAFSPRSVLMTVQPDGSVVLVGTDAYAAADPGTCSPVPSGFNPPPTPLPTAQNVQVATWLSDPHPAANELEFIYGRLTSNGQPVPGVTMSTTWSFPDGQVFACSGVTDDTGTASCSEYNVDPRHGASVSIQVHFTYAGQDFITYNSYIQ